ncbi:hypothetical protein tpqmel_0564 [Candidatus Gastranaerophilus sp. (ex Termes propinquus)]|nr:hypothetical protein tpqmel_0564 [Candidatus Gastranaerophilus sp. (ex Termes propinquus)]
MTTDGISYVYDGDSPPFADIYVDVNGPKGPNQLGRDLFVLTLWWEPENGINGRAEPRLGLKPAGTFSSYTGTTNVAMTAATRDGTGAGGCNVSASTSGVFAAGWNCAAKVLAEGAMNY